MSYLPPPPPRGIARPACILPLHPHMQCCLLPMCWYTCCPGFSSFCCQGVWVGCRSCTNKCFRENFYQHLVFLFKSDVYLNIYVSFNLKNPSFKSSGSMNIFYYSNHCMSFGHKLHCFKKRFMGKRHYNRWYEIVMRKSFVNSGWRINKSIIF